MTRAAHSAIVIGAGHAGLAVAAMLKRRGVECVVLERGRSVATAWRRRHDSLHLNTERWLSGLPGLPIPPEYGRWVSRDDFIAYLEAYTRFHSLDVRFEVEAARIDRTDGGWTVSTSDGPLGARRVVVATGLHQTPHLPAWPGRSEFRGEIVHAGAYRNPLPYQRRPVLVVGAGVSGAEIAVELSQNGAAATWLAMRTPPYVIRPRVLGVVSPGALAVAAGGIPPRVLNALTAATARITIGDLSRYGVARPRNFFSRTFEQGRMPVLDRGFTEALKARDLEVVPAVERFEGDAVVLADGSRRRPDVVIAATGYRPDLEPLVGHLGVLGPDGRPRAHGAASPPDAPGLHFVGFRYALAGQFREARLMARAIGRSAHS